MTDAPQGPKAVSAVELKAPDRDRASRPTVRLLPRPGRRAGDRGDRGGCDELWIGRSPSADVHLEWDVEVSSLHAQLEVVRDECTLVDEGLSTNGSFVNGERVGGRRHLRDGDTIRVGPEPDPVP